MGRRTMKHLRTALLSGVTFCLVILAYWTAGTAGTVEVEGVSLAQEIVLDETGETLVLNGAGVRKKFVVKVYVAALYLEEKSGDPEGVIGQQGRKRILLHILHKKVGAKKLRNAWREGFAEWLPIRQVAELSQPDRTDAAPPPPTARRHRETN